MALRDCPLAASAAGIARPSAARHRRRRPPVAGRRARLVAISCPPVARTHGAPSVNAEAFSPQWPIRLYCAAHGCTHEAHNEWILPIGDGLGFTGLAVSPLR